MGYSRLRPAQLQGLIGLTLRISFDLSERDLRHFDLIMMQARDVARVSDVGAVIRASRALLQSEAGRPVPDFIAQRLDNLRLLVEMLSDDEWRLPKDEATRAVNALAYFVEPDDLIPDHIPGLGFLDDAIMVELVVRDMKTRHRCLSRFLSVSRTTGGWPGRIENTRFGGETPAAPRQNDASEQARPVTMPASQSTATEQRAAEIAREHFGIDGDVVRMGGADSLNFRCSDRENGQWVLKLTEIDNRDVIGLQQSALSWLNPRLPDIVFPEPRSPLSGELPVVDFLGEQRLAWMLRHRPGRVLVECQEEIDDPGTQLGTIVGRVDRALSGFSDDRARRMIRWDLAQCAALRDGLTSIEQPGQQRMATEILTRCLEELATLSPSLRKSVIHGDANDHNLLASDGVITTVIDFGDVVESWRVADPAIAAAYHLMDKPDPLAAALEVLAAYHREWALNEHEIAAFLPLVEIRLCMTVIHSAQADEDPYKHVHTEPAWRALSTLHRRVRREGLFRSRAACGLIANPELNSLTGALRRAEVSSVLPADIMDDCVLLDLSVQNDALSGVAGNAGNAEKLGEWLFGEIERKAALAVA